MPTRPVTPEDIQRNRDTFAAWLRAHRDMHDVAEAAKDPSAAEFLVIDVRSRASFAKGHVRGAFSLPLTDLAHEAVRLPHGLPLVTYCGGGT